ncbi:GntR family transcriptional regulator [Periweissella cryptocerci]|uniref:GntR family transcriptional regulator n=1 Tax=Periweissella cryptocerci TaxID=2506420 RepID=A0A4P6YWE7_9LACO|nr:GntR family transcriptional regulator [Periweissella cryptocerci]QBO37103.1 GntR family transcriptional regulator [Periweissella cryptocerci]
MNQKSGRPLYEQLMYGIKEDILLGILQVGDKLPSVREMAQRQLVNPNTVAKAYKALEAQGIIETVLGRGTFVAMQLSGDVDDRQLQIFKQQLSELLTEATYMGLTEQKMQALVAEWYGGNHGIKSKQFSEND